MALDWLKNGLPRNLYGRAALILVVPVVILQLTFSVGFVQRHFADVTRQMTRSVLYELRYLVDEVSAAGTAERALREVAEVSAALDLSVTLPAGPAPAADSWRWRDLTAPRVVAVLREGLPGLLAARLPDSQVVDLWIEVPQGVMEVRFDRARVSASNPHQLLVLTLGLALLMTGIAYVFLRNQLRPIKRMAAAATEFGRGRIVPYAPSGATEVRAAGAAFLDMRNRIERQRETRTMMLSGVSHDLRTPLTRLRLGLSMLPEDEAAPLIRDVEEMQRLTDAFLDFARGDAEGEMGRGDPAEIAASVVADAVRTGAAAALRPVEGEAAEVALRPVAVRRALENLLSNALRHGTRAEVAVAFGEKSVRLTVEDDGPGIPPEARGEAIRPFTRLDPARNQDRGSGVGLGLAIVADIARAHGGALRLGESERLGGLKADLVIAR
ncbi:ATP-binding protein [Wenxinia marina]|uniref:histidine kinase n=1 Tax=Wenxinia marina DSM 24838 TaxID=1123501 RepID=A0A0D0Q2X6_9RHOB|nr:ATP-binding protein [Wenxinia marina]KIQ68904.1 Signal transduction histidine kinase [Wenxinia marina DSM 24838]GGL64323.1 two-component sensor histidine kinase [Wenxinia marina]